MPREETMKERAARVAKSSLSRTATSIVPKQLKPFNRTNGPNSGSKLRADSTISRGGKSPQTQTKWLSKNSNNLSPEKTAYNLPPLKQSQTKHENSDRSLEQSNQSMQRKSSLQNFRAASVNKRANTEISNDDISQLQSTLVSIFKDDDEKKRLMKRQNKKVKNVYMETDPAIYEDVNGVPIGSLLKKIDTYLAEETDPQFAENLELEHIPKINRILDKYSKGRDVNDFVWEINPRLVKIREENVLTYYTYKNRGFKSYRKKHMTTSDIV